MQDLGSGWLPKRITELINPDMNSTIQWPKQYHTRIVFFFQGPFECFFLVFFPTTTCWNKHSTQKPLLNIPQNNPFLFDRSISPWGDVSQLPLGNCNGCLWASTLLSLGTRHQVTTTDAPWERSFPFWKKKHGERREREKVVLEHRFFSCFFLEVKLVVGRLVIFLSAQKWWCKVLRGEWYWMILMVVAMELYKGEG